MSYMLRAVVVGIDEYADVRHREVSSLQCASHDAWAIANVLRTSTAFSREADNPRLLTNTQANRRAVRRAIETCFSSKGLNSKTIALFYFAGHGVLKNERVFLCCHDVDFYDPEEGGIRLNEVYDWLENCDAECAIAIIDACFSGGLTTKLPGHISPSEHAKKAIVNMQAPEGKTMAILAACLSDQTAREDPRQGHGIFTQQLLRGLCDDSLARNLDGIVTLNGLTDYLSNSFAHELHKQPKFSHVFSRPIPLWKGNPLVGGEAAQQEEKPRPGASAETHTPRAIKPAPPRPIQPPARRNVTPSSVPDFVLEFGSPKDDYNPYIESQPGPIQYPPTSNLTFRKRLMLFGCILLALLFFSIMLFHVFKP